MKTPTSPLPTATRALHPLELEVVRNLIAADSIQLDDALARKLVATVDYYAASSDRWQSLYQREVVPASNSLS